jgi:hypothetical protein
MVTCLRGPMLRFDMLHKGRAGAFRVCACRLMLILSRIPYIVVESDRVCPASTNSTQLDLC